MVTEGACRPAGGRIVSVRKPGAHCRAEDVGPVKAGSTIIGANDNGAANCVSYARPEAVRRALSEISRVLVKGGSQHKITEKVLRDDVCDRRAEALCKRDAVCSVFGIGVGQVRDTGVKNAATDGDRVHRLSYKVVPFVVNRHRRGGGLVGVSDVALGNNMGLVVVR